MTDFQEIIQRIFNGEKALSYSALSAFLKSPRHYYKYVMDKETTEAMEKGKRFHMAILELDKFKEKYFVLDDTAKVIEIGGGNPRITKIYKEWKAGELAKNSGKELIKKDEYDIYQLMIIALQNHSICKTLLFGGGENEKDFEYEDGDYKFRGKIDHAREKYTVDLKKVADASYQKVKWDIERMNYDLQGVIYSKANRSNLHYIVYIDEGCNITVCEAGKEKLISWESKYTNALDAFTRCLQEDKWNMSYDFWQPVVRL